MVFKTQVELVIFEFLNENGVCVSQEDEARLASLLADHLMDQGLINRVGVSYPYAVKKKRRVRS